VRHFIVSPNPSDIRRFLIFLPSSGVRASCGDLDLCRYIKMKNVRDQCIDTPKSKREREEEVAGVARDTTFMGAGDSQIRI
jgi:hypothetical protein